MTHEDWRRLWMHVPWGLAAVGLFLAHPLLGTVACLMELGYEFINDIGKGDKSYKDVIGIVWGVLGGGYILLVLKIYGVIPL